MPSLSIIVPIYGVEQYLNRALDSVLAQSYKDFEVLLVDDGSKDRSGEICDSYCASDNRFKVCHKENGGYSSAINWGLDNAKGDYIAILEPDDWLPDNAYNLLMSTALEKDADIVKGRFMACYPDCEVMGLQNIVFLAQKGVLPGQAFGILLHSHPSVWTCVYKRVFIEEHHIRMLEAKGAAWTDNPWQVMTLFLAKRVCCIDELVYNYQILDRNAANLLKDWHVPFDRMDDVYSWLGRQSDVENGFLAGLYKRDLGYIMLCMKKVTLSNCKEMRKRIRDVVSLWSYEVIKQYDDVHFRIIIENYYRFGFFRAFAVKSAFVSLIWRLIERLQRLFYAK